MQTFGVLLLAVAAWLIYCGVSLISPWETALAIMANPGDATGVLETAKAAASGETKKLTSGAGTDFSGGAGKRPEATPPGAGNAASLYTQDKVTDGWDEHKERGSDGGTDYAMPVGTPLPTPFTGVLTNNPNGGTGGYTATVSMANGWKAQFLHLSKFNDSAAGKVVKVGDIIGWSGGAKGAVGAGSSTGAHVHIHMIDPSGVRKSFPVYLLTQKG